MPTDSRSSAQGSTTATRDHGDGDAGPESIEVIHEERDAAHRDRIRWGPIWAGIVVALGTFILLQLALVAIGLFDVASPQTEDALWSAVAAGVAFLLGGVTAGATALWRGVDDGLLHGVVLWAVALVTLIALSSIGGGMALGAIDTTEVFDDVTQTDVEDVLADDAQDAAGQALLALTVALVAAALGGVLGAKLWPRVDEIILDRSEPRGPSTRPRPPTTPAAPSAGGPGTTTGGTTNPGGGPGATPPR